MTNEECNKDFEEFMNTDSMEYLITGNTFSFKEDLKAWGCVWVSEKKAWKTPPLEENEIAYLRLKSITKAHGAYMNPIELSPECQKIQNILNGIR